MKCYAGFDTSCYTTSFSLVCGDEVLIDERIVLDVKQGDRGLRQSDAVFQHVRNYDKIFDKLKVDYDIAGVAASTAPRKLEGSYMPVFTVGASFAKALAAAKGANFYGFSHQQDHIMAALSSADRYDLTDKPFIAFHLSGGTTEMLLVRNGRCEIIGGTKDISFGKLIDRVGVSLGLSFPCGRHMEELAFAADGFTKLKSGVKGTYVNLSGAETALLKQIKGSPEEIAAATLNYAAECIYEMCTNAREEYKIDDILLMGGVAANKQLRIKMEGKACFGSPKLSCDNAVGIAFLAQRRDLTGHDL